MIIGAQGTIWTAQARNSRIDREGLEDQDEQDEQDRQQDDQHDICESYAMRASDRRHSDAYNKTSDTVPEREFWAIT